MLHKWRSATLAEQFILASCAVSVIAMLAVGSFVSNLIAHSVIRHAGSTTALYVDSVVAPVLPDMATTTALDDVSIRALNETLSAGGLAKKLISFRLWSKDAIILYASRPELAGKRFPPSRSLISAFSGNVVSEYEIPDDIESQAERALGIPLLEIYSPVRQPWTGEVVAVAEFYELAPELAQTLVAARLKGWAAVAVVTLALVGSLAMVVLRGSRTIETQQSALRAKVAELAELAQNNAMLAQEVQESSVRATAFNERFLRRLGADLHDGPAQHVAFAALRLGSKVFREDSQPRTREIEVVKESLADAMAEIRTISAGLAIPHIDTASVSEVIKAAVSSHELRTGSKVNLTVSEETPTLDADLKTCIFRFMQEALSNAYRHAGRGSVEVYQKFDGYSLVIDVADHGPGFDVAAIPADRLGLACLTQRIRSLGGYFQISSSRDGTRLRLRVDSVHHQKGQQCVA